MGKTEKTQEKKQRNKKGRAGTVIAIILLIILLTLSAFYVWDKLRINKSLKAVTAERDSLAYDYNYYKTQYDSQNRSYVDLKSKYDALLDSSLTGNELSEKNKQELLRLQNIIQKQDSIVSAINKIVSDALMGFNSDELNVEMKNGKLYITMQDKLLFQSGSADVEEKGVEALGKLSSILRENNDIDIMIEGHTDNVPISTEKYPDNWALSVDRANSIVRLLTIKYNLDPTRITAAGRAENAPVGSNETTEGKAKNRRIEIVLTPNLEELYKLVDLEEAKKIEEANTQNNETETNNQ